MTYPAGKETIVTNSERDVYIGYHQGSNTEIETAIKELYNAMKDPITKIKGLLKDDNAFGLCFSGLYNDNKKGELRENRMVLEWHEK